MRAALAPLRAAPFRRLLASYTVNEVGNLVGIVALALLVYDETGDPLATSALFVAAQFVPSLLAPLIVARVERLPMRQVLPGMYVIEAALFGVLALLAQDFLLPAVLVVVLVDGALMLAARGLTRAAVHAALEPAGLLREGNGLMNIGFAVAAVGGAALGGLLTGAFGASTALLLDAASFLAVAALLAGADLPAPEHSESQRVWQRLRDGLRFAREQRHVRLLLAGESVAVLLFTVIVPIEVLYAKQTLGTDDTGYGLLLAAWGAGIVVGSFGFLRLARWSTTTLILVSTVAIGTAYLGMGLSRELWLACAFSVVGGAGNGVQWVSVVTAIQEATPSALQARVTGLLESIASAVTGAGFLLGGLLVALTRPEIAFLVSGAGVLVLSAGLGLGSRPRRPRAAPSVGA
jgi:predicted MFS family arabinose efflux permease